MSFDYENANISDKIRLVGELEHIYYHAKRSAQLSAGTDDEIFYQVTAKRAKDLRRKYMNKMLPECDEKLWCLGKAAASLKQCAYETDSGDSEMLHEIDSLADGIWSKITGEDLYGCAACREDMKTDE